jgi:hypothetical protein
MPAHLACRSAIHLLEKSLAARAPGIGEIFRRSLLTVYHREHILRVAFVEHRDKVFFAAVVVENRGAVGHQKGVA